MREVSLGTKTYRVKEMDPKLGPVIETVEIIGYAKVVSLNMIPGAFGDPRILVELENGDVLNSDDICLTPAEAMTAAGLSPCLVGGHDWHSSGGRSCPHACPMHNTSQTVYTCTQCNAYDHGEEGGPGHADCVKHCGLGQNVPVAEQMVEVTRDINGFKGLQTVTVWKTRDGRTFKTRDEAVRWIEDLEDHKA